MNLAVYLIQIQISTHINFITSLIKYIDAVEV